MINRDIINILVQYTAHNTICRILYIIGYDRYIYNIRSRRLSGLILYKNKRILYSDAYGIHIRYYSNDIFMYDIYKYDNIHSIYKRESKLNSIYIHAFIYNSLQYASHGYVYSYIYANDGTYKFRVPICDRLGISNASDKSILYTYKNSIVIDINLSNKTILLRYFGTEFINYPSYFDETDQIYIYEIWDDIIYILPSVYNYRAYIVFK